MNEDTLSGSSKGTCYSFTDKSLEYYVEKFQRRIFRRLVEYQILRDHFEADYEKVKTSIRELLGLDDEVIHELKVKDHIEKACLTGLKTEFELFFTIYCTFVLDHLVDRLEQGEVRPEVKKLLLKVVKDPKFYQAFVEARLKDARRIAVEQLVPDSGLSKFEEVLNEAGWPVVDDELDLEDGWNLGEELSGLIKTPWKQIQMAFQVRHAIEHNFSKVSAKGRFMHRAVESGALKGSTWRRWWGPPETQPKEAGKCDLGHEPKPGDRILIDPVDVRGTAAAMAWASTRLMNYWKSRVSDHRN